MKYKSKINKLFFALCLALAIWAFGFFMSNSSQTVEVSLLWRRICALGWGSFYAFMLHFSLTISNRKFQNKFNLLEGLLYIPALIIIYIFSLSNHFAQIQYNLVKMDYGWLNIPVNNLWDIFFYFYYIGYVLASLVLTWRWKKSEEEGEIAKVSKNINLAILITVILGTFTDVGLNSFIESPIPQMAPVLSLIIVSTLYYHLTYDKAVLFNTRDKDELIISDKVRKILDFYLSIILIILGLFTLAIRYVPLFDFDAERLRSGIYTGIALISLGLIGLSLQVLKDEKLKNFISILIVLLSIPIISLRQIESGGITIWTYPVILILFSLVFTTRTFLILVTLVSMATQYIIMMNGPKGLISIGLYDYILRQLGFLIVFFIGLLVNNLYVKKLKENRRQLNSQKLVSEISFDFVNLSQKNIDYEINSVLKKIGETFNIDRAYVFLHDNEKRTLNYKYEWCNEGISQEMDILNDVSLDFFPWWISELERNKIIHLEDIGDLPEEAYMEKKILEAQDIKSVLVMAIEEKDELLGFIGLDAVRAHKKWEEHEKKLLDILANILANGLLKIRAEKDIERLAYYDHLTGLPNRTLFNDRLNQAIYLSKRTNCYIGVIFLDLDGFKDINDSIGHSAGDTILKEVGQALKGSLREMDTVARFGGDEFLIMVNNIKEAEEIPKIAKKIMGAFEESFTSSGREFHLTSSAGIAIYPIDGEDSESLIKNADIAMYRAKANGKNQYSLCSTEMKEEVKRDMILSNDLHRALEREELFLVYQPQINLERGEIVGVEALLRWNHSEMGLIPPRLFIRLAEKNGLIGEIGDWTMRTAIKQNKEWQEKGYPHIRMSINLSIEQLKDIRLVDRINEILKENELEAKYLELEITESIAIKEVESTIDMLEKLNKSGISIAIDDFGVEYSSLNRLKTLPINRIKIDMHFVQNIESSEKDRSIIEVIINLAENLGLEAIGEGVETEEQANFLRSKGCQDGQGFYFYRPMLAEKFEKLINNS